MNHVYEQGSNKAIGDSSEIEKIEMKERKSSPDTKDLSSADQIRMLSEAIEVKTREIHEQESNVTDTEKEWETLRSKLDLPPLQNEIESISTDESGLQKMRDQLEKLKERKKQLEQQEKSLNENDLIVSDSQVKAAEKVLDDERVPHESKLYRKREVIPEGGGEVPGSYVLTIFDPERPDQPAPAEVTEEAFELIKAADLAVSYGKRPNKNQEVSN